MVYSKIILRNIVINFVSKKSYNLIVIDLSFKISMLKITSPTFHNSSLNIKSILHLSIKKLRC